MTALVQRRTDMERKLVSDVALATADRIYKGKCDAVPKGAQVRHTSSRGLIAKDVAIIFECGPQSFRFSAKLSYFDDSRPWSLDLVGGGTGWVTERVGEALDNIYDDIDDVGTQFWGGYHVIVDQLEKELEVYCG